MINKTDKNQERLVRHARVRTKLSGTSEKPRLCVKRSLNGIYAQIIDDSKGVTLVSASTLDADLKAKLKDLNKSEQAKVIGQAIAKKAAAKKITDVVFDRGGYIFTGRVKELADSARASGLKF